MKNIIKYIKENGLDLKVIGVNNFALKKKESLKVLNKFKENNIFLYGGDFLEKKEGQINYNYTNWSTNGKDIMYNLEYAEDFIKKYAMENMYIAFVTDIDLYDLVSNFEDN